MVKQTRRRFTPEYKEQGVVRLSEDGVTYGFVASQQQFEISPAQ